LSGMIEKIKVWFKLIRPPLFVLGFLVSFALLRFYNVWNEDFTKGLLITLSVGFGHAAFTLFNEIHDVPQDKINKPWKPLPSGLVSVQRAMILSIIMFLISLFSLLAIYDTRYILLGLIGYIGSFYYNLTNDRAVIGYIFYTLPFFIACFISTGLKDIVLPLIFTFIAICQNMGVQLQDLEADMRANVKTLPQVIGKTKTKIICSILCCITISFICVSILPTISKFLFILSTIMIMIGTITELQELFLRIGSRSMVLLGFLSIILR